MTLYGPDLSNNNWSSTTEIAGWLDDCFHTEGYSWMEHKVSEGNYYYDPFWPTVRDWCAANNVPCIGYHYVTTDDPASQAAKFVANGGGNIAMLDFEANSGDIRNFWNVVDAFNAAGVQINLSYIPRWYWGQIGNPDLSQAPGLIASSYYERGAYGSVEYNDAGGDNGPGWNAYGGAVPAIWQFSDGALIGGKSVDANAFRGTLDQLTQLITGAPVVQPTPAPVPPPNLPVFFTVEGHSSNMFAGPVADTATQLESQGLCHHQPIGYNNGPIPFDNQSGVNELARLVGATVMDNGVPFPAGTKWALGTFSQGSIVGYDFAEQFLAPGKPLEWREKDRVATLAYGNPCRATNSIAPWAAGSVTTPNTHGLDPYKRFGLSIPVPPNFIDVYREGDIFAENGDDKASQVKAAVYEAVARSDVFSNPASLAFQIAALFQAPVQEVFGIIQAMISGVVFLADQPSPHYSPYDISGGVAWMRTRLTA